MEINTPKNTNSTSSPDSSQVQVMIDSLAGFCHALGQPATVLMSSIELLRMPNVDEKTRKEILDVSYDAVQEIARLLADMKTRREYLAQSYLGDSNAGGKMLSIPEWAQSSPPPEIVSL